jgi:hypothetical protein
MGAGHRIRKGARPKRRPRPVGAGISPRNRLPLCFPRPRRKTAEGHQQTGREHQGEGRIPEGLQDGPRTPPCPRLHARFRRGGGYVYLAEALDPQEPADDHALRLSSQRDLETGFGRRRRGNQRGPLREFIHSEVSGENWEWRLSRDALTPTLTHKSREITETYGRG